MGLNMHDQNSLPQMASFANTLRNRIDPIRVNRLLLNERAAKVLSHYVEDGELNNNEFKIAGWDGGAGGSLCFNITSGVYKDFGDSSPGGQGILSYLGRLWKVNIQVVIDRLVNDGFLVPKEVYGTSRKSKKGDYGALILPAPEDDPVESAIKPSKQGHMKGQWAYRDIDGSLLGYVIRFEEPGGKKQTPPYTYWSEGGWKKTDWGGQWPLYGLEQLSQKGKGAKIVIVEGEKTAEKAQALLPGCVVLGFGGVNKVDKLELGFLADTFAEREIVIWPDNDTVGVKAAKKLAWRLSQDLRCKQVKRVLVEQMEELKGRDGWDLADYEEGCGIRLMATLDAAEDQTSIDSFVNNWVYVIRRQQFFHISNVNAESGLDEKQFRNAWCHLVPKLDAVLLEDSRLQKLDNVTFWPGQPRFVTDKGSRKLNMWAPDGLLADLETVNYAEQGLVYSRESALKNTKMFREHLDFVFPDQRVRDIFLSYLKFLIEEPGEKANWAPLIQGAQGIGKTYFAVLLSDILGPRNVVPIGNDQITGENTGWMMNATLAVVEEVNMGGRREFTDRLKPLITSNRITIREKYIPDTTLDNRVNFLMFTNHRDALILEDGDRRFLVYYSPADVSTRDPSYYDRLFQEARENLWWIYQFIQNEVQYVEGLDFKGPAPFTESKREMINNSVRDIDYELREAVELSNPPFHKDIVSTNEIVEFLREQGYSKVTPISVGMAMTRLKWTRLNNQYRWGKGNTEKIRVWAVRNVDQWLKASAEELREEFNKTMGVESPNIVGFKSRQKVF